MKRLKINQDFSVEEIKGRAERGTLNRDDIDHIPALLTHIEELNKTIESLVSDIKWMQIKQRIGLSK
jgi:hypothetical protein